MSQSVLQAQMIGTCCRWQAMARKERISSLLCRPQTSVSFKAQAEGLASTGYISMDVIFDGTEVNSRLTV
jgi:hypothetical protein